MIATMALSVPGCGQQNTAATPQADTEAASAASDSEEPAAPSEEEPAAESGDTGEEAAAGQEYGPARCLSEDGFLPLGRKRPRCPLRQKPGEGRPSRRQRKVAEQPGKLLSLLLGLVVGHQIEARILPGDFPDKGRDRRLA